MAGLRLKGRLLVAAREGEPPLVAPVPLRLGVSSCLLGEKVRYDGAHKRADALLARLADFVEWVPCCPEVEIGLGIPREPIELRPSPTGPRLVGLKSGRDLTEKMTQHARKRSAELAARDLDGYILKSRSPSCGILTPGGQGLFSREIIARLFALPVIEEDKLTSIEGQLHFVERAEGLRRVREALAGDWTMQDARDLVARHELQLRAHSEAAWSHVRAALEMLAQVLGSASIRESPALPPEPHAPSATTAAGPSTPSPGPSAAPSSARRLTPRERARRILVHAFSRGFQVRPTPQRRLIILREVADRCDAGVGAVQSGRDPLRALLEEFAKGRGNGNAAHLKAIERVLQGTDASLRDQTWFLPGPCWAHLMRSS